MFNRIRSCLLGTLLFVWAAATHAAWPSERAIELVVPFPAGSSPDILARALAQPLAQTIGQSIIILNRPGAGGNIGTRQVATAKPDGYTLLYTINGPLVTAPTLWPETLGYDPIKDLAPVSLVATSPNVLIVSPEMDVSTLISLSERLRANPEKFNYGSVGVGSASHLAMALFLAQTDLSMLHVPYQGFPAVINAMLSNEIQASFMVPAIAMTQVKAGNVKALGITSLDPVPELAGIEPLAQQGLVGFEAVSWNAMLAPAGTPEKVLRQLSEAVSRILQDPGMTQKFASLYFTPIGSSPDVLKNYIQAETDHWAPVIRQLGVTLER